MFRNVEAKNGKIPADNPFKDLFDQHKEVPSTSPPGNGQGALFNF